MQRLDCAISGHRVVSALTRDGRPRCPRRVLQQVLGLSSPCCSFEHAIASRATSTCTSGAPVSFTFFTDQLVVPVLPNFLRCPTQETLEPKDAKHWRLPTKDRGVPSDTDVQIPSAWACMHTGDNMLRHHCDHASTGKPAGHHTTHSSSCSGRDLELCATSPATWLSFFVFEGIGRDGRVEPFRFAGASPLLFPFV